MDNRREFLKKIAAAALGTASSPMDAVAKSLGAVVEVTSYGTELDDIGLHLSKYITSSAITWTHSKGKVIAKGDYGDDMHEAVMQSFCKNPNTWLEVKLKINAQLQGAGDLSADIDSAFSGLQSHLPFDEVGTRMQLSAVKNKLVELAKSSVGEIKRQHERVDRKRNGLLPKPDFADRASAAKVGGYAPEGWVFRVEAPEAMKYEIPSQAR